MVGLASLSVFLLFCSQSCIGIDNISHDDTVAPTDKLMTFTAAAQTTIHMPGNRKKLPQNDRRENDAREFTEKASKTEQSKATSSDTDTAYYDDFSFGVSFLYAYIQIGLAVLGTIGNALGTLTWSKVKHFNTTAFLLSFLGACDFSFLLLMILIQIFHLAIDNFTYNLSWALYILVYVSYVAQFLSIFTTVVVSISRYVAVKFPFKVQVWFSKSSMKILMCAMILISALSAVPAPTLACLFLYAYLPTDVNSNVTTESASTYDGHLTIDTSNMSNSADTNWFTSPGPRTKALKSKEDYHHLPPTDMIEVCLIRPQDEKIFLTVANAMMNVIPWLIVIPMNLLLIAEVKKSAKNREQITYSEEQKYRTMDGVVIIVSLQSIVAYPIFFLIELLTISLDWEYFFGAKPPFPIDPDDSVHIVAWRECLHILNSSLNIVAYVACGSRFRKILLKEVLTCGCKTKKPPKRPEAESGTATQQM